MPDVVGESVHNAKLKTTEHGRSLRVFELSAFEEKEKAGQYLCGWLKHGPPVHTSHAHAPQLVQTVS